MFRFRVCWKSPWSTGCRVAKSNNWKANTSGGKLWRTNVVSTPAPSPPSARVPLLIGRVCPAQESQQRAAIFAPRVIGRPTGRKDQRQARLEFVGQCTAIGYKRGLDKRLTRVERRHRARAAPARLPTRSRLRSGFARARLRTGTAVGGRPPASACRRPESPAAASGTASTNRPPCGSARTRCARPRRSAPPRSAGSDCDGPGPCRSSRARGDGSCRWASPGSCTGDCRPRIRRSSLHP